VDPAIGVARWGQRGHAPKFLEYLVILCFKRCYLIKILLLA